MKNSKWEDIDWEIKYESLVSIVALFLILNVSVFIASGLVKDFKYYFPVIALVLLLIVQFIIIMPFSNLRNKKTYSTLFFIVCLAAYFIIASFVYLIQHEDFISIREIPHH